MSELINTHISLRVPGATPTYLLNPHGLLFNQITASSLVKLDFAGKVAGPSEWPVNRAGVAIHGSILAARPDINCVFHTHMPYTTAVSALQCGLLPMSQAALRFQGQTAYHDYGRAASDPAECARLVKDLGGKPVMLLRNHGGITTGKTVCEAFIASFYLEKAPRTTSSPHPAAVPPAMIAPGQACCACSIARTPLTGSEPQPITGNLAQSTQRPQRELDRNQKLGVLCALGARQFEKF
jgi:ribulose-5-phosphate 4-epimerase/fuculose-1-phosphate aldolase